jgi:predicted nucleic acid-binding protein
MIILDTDTLTHYSYGKENVRKKVESVGEDEQLAITLITRNEILRGRADSLLKASDEAELKKAMERFRQTEEMLAAFRILPIDDEAVNQFGRLRKEKKLKKIGRADLLIACIALAQDALLVTRNEKDFKLVTGLRRENWVD